MTANKYGIKDITLLSNKDYNRISTTAPDVLGLGEYKWWLSTPGLNNTSVMTVSEDGMLCSLGDNVDSIFIGVRPVLVLENKNNFNNISVGADVTLFNFNWVKVSETMLLCSDVITLKPFNSDVKKGNNFKTSELAVFLYMWVSEKLTEEKSDNSVYQLVLKIHDKCPDLRLGQILANVSDNLYYISDEELADKLNNLYKQYI